MAEPGPRLGGRGGTARIAERTEPYVNLAERQVDWVGLRLEAAHWPRADRVLVDVAHDLTAGFEPGDAAEFYPAERIALADLVIDLDQPRTDLVQAAVNLRRGACSYRQARRLAERTVCHRERAPAPVHRTAPFRASSTSSPVRPSPGQGGRDRTQPRHDPGSEVNRFPILVKPDCRAHRPLAVRTGSRSGVPGPGGAGVVACPQGPGRGVVEAPRARAGSRQDACRGAVGKDLRGGLAGGGRPRRLPGPGAGLGVAGGVLRCRRPGRLLAGR